LLVCSSTLSHAADDRAQIARDLRKLAMLAVPCRIRIAYEALSWGRHVNEYTQAWDLVAEADRANLGLAIDSFHILATGTSTERLEEVVAGKVVLVQLADFMWREIRSREERIDTARHFRVFPGEGVHSAEVAKLVRTLDDLGYRGDYSFEVFNDDYTQLPHAVVAERARRSVKWLTDQVSRRSLPLRGAAR
jgi:sugar phosphate isomerase/epimerase